MDDRKSAAQLQMEVEDQRQRLENRVSELQERLSAGQLVDEFVGFARHSGGPDFVANLGRSVQANPLPIALTGIGLAWLMARANAPANSVADTDRWHRNAGDSQSHDQGEYYPFARIKGSSLRRVRQITDDAGERYSEFADDAGAKFRALSDEMGRRRGHFTDEAGARYRGFTDEAGNRVRNFLDEAGARLEDAQGWASETWENVSGRVGGIGDAVADRAAAVADKAAGLRHRASHAGGRLQDNAGAMSKTLSDLLHEQPLIAGALAFAAGAAIASALPPTPQEDKLAGASSDRLKAKGARVAGDAYEQGRERVTEVVEELQEEAGSVYNRAKGDLASDTAVEDKGRLH